VIDTTTAAPIVNPTAYMMGTEIDSYFPTGSGTDVNAKRIGLFIGAGPKGAVDTAIHAFAAININTAGTIDNEIILKTHHTVISRI